MCLTQWKISSPIIHRGLNMWRNYVLQIPRIVESFLSVFRIVSFVRFDSIVHKGWYEFVYVCIHTRTIARAYMTSQCSSKPFCKKGTKRPLRVTRLTSPLSRRDFPKCPTKVFRISFSVLRSQYAAVLQSEALVASVSRHSHNTGRYTLFHPRESRILRMSIAHRCFFFSLFLLFYYILICHFFTMDTM